MHHSSLERFVRERNQRAGHAGRGCLILGSKLKAALYKTIKRFMLNNLSGEHNGKNVAIGAISPMLNPIEEIYGAIFLNHRELNHFHTVQRAIRP